MHASIGEVTKWLKVSDLKSDRSRKRREGSNPSFSAHSLRECKLNIFFNYFGEVPKLAEGAPLERE